MPIIAALAALLAVAGGVFASGSLPWMRVKASAANPGQSRAPVAVTVAVAATKDVPIYLTGLGSALPTFTVAIHSQIDGKLQDVLFTEGQQVKKGDVLAKIDPRIFQAALDQAKAKKAQDEATLIGLQKDLTRFQTLGTKGYDTQQNIDNQQAKVDTTKATIEADIAAIETAQTQLDYTDIKATSDGRMGVRNVDPGNVVHASDQQAIATLVLTQPTNVLFTLPAQTLEDVRAAQARGEVQVLAYDRDNKKLLSTGTLATIDNLIDQTTASYKLKAVFSNTDERLWPGLFVNARLLVDTSKGAVVIPNGAVQHGPQGLFTWVISSDNKASVRPIKVAQSADGGTIVTAGVTAGERVVTAGQLKLTANAPVTVGADAVADAGGGT